MKRRPYLRPLLGLWLTWLMATACADGAIEVSDAWIREAPPTATVHAAYLTLHNPGSEAVVIDSVSSPDFAGAEIHRSLIEDGIARMLPVTRLELAAGERLELAPGGYHLMLFDAQRPLQAGASVSLLLHLADGHCIRVDAPVRRVTGTD